MAQARKDRQSPAEGVTAEQRAKSEAGEEKEGGAGAAAGEEAALFEGDGSDGFELDLNDVDENAGGFTAIPRGNYQAIVDDVIYGNSQRSGNPMWTWTFEVCEGEYTGRKLFFHSPFTPNMISRVKRVLTRVAPELANTKFNPKEVAESGALLGKRATLRVDVRKYEGENRNNVKDVLPPQDGNAGGDFLSST